MGDLGKRVYYRIGCFIVGRVILYGIKQARLALDSVQCFESFAVLGMNGSFSVALSICLVKVCTKADYQ